MQHCFSALPVTPPVDHSTANRDLITLPSDRKDGAFRSNSARLSCRLLFERHAVAGPADECARFWMRHSRVVYVKWSRSGRHQQTSSPRRTVSKSPPTFNAEVFFYYNRQHKKGALEAIDSASFELPLRIYFKTCLLCSCCGQNPKKCLPARRTRLESWLSRCVSWKRHHDQVFISWQ